MLARWFPEIETDSDRPVRTGIISKKKAMFDLFSYPESRMHKGSSKGNTI
jgi:hypothetical protein